MFLWHICHCCIVKYMDIQHESGNAFELSQNVQAQRFEQCTQNLQWVNDVAQWHTEALANVRNQRVTEDDLPGQRLVVPFRFPGNINPKVLAAELQSDDLAAKIARRINNSPFIVLDSPDLPMVDEDTTDETRGRGGLLAGFHATSLTVNGESRQGQNATIIAEHQEEADELARALRLNPGEATYAQLAYTAGFMEKSRRELQKAMYAKFVLDQARDCILAIAPDLANDLDKTMQSVLPLTTDSIVQQPASVKIANIHCVVMPDVTDMEQPIDSEHAVRLMMTGHEILHALVNDYLGLPPEKPGYRNRGLTDTLDPDEQDKLDRIKSGSLGRTLLEGISIAFEHELVEQVVQQTGDATSIEALNQIAQLRLQGIREVNRMLNPDYQAAHAAEFGLTEPLDPSTVDSFTYSEGARLAIYLRNQGWTLNDLPQLLDQIKAIVQEETGSYDGVHVCEIGINKDEGSEYMRIVHRVRQLHKPN